MQNEDTFGKLTLRLRDYPHNWYSFYIIISINVDIIIVISFSGRLYV